MTVALGIKSKIDEVLSQTSVIGSDVIRFGSRSVEWTGAWAKGSSKSLMRLLIGSACYDSQQSECRSDEANRQWAKYKKTPTETMKRQVKYLTRNILTFADWALSSGIAIGLTDINNLNFH